MKKQIKYWFCGSLALWLAVPACAYDEKVQQQLNTEIANSLRQGKNKQARQVLNAMPKCPEKDTVYERESDVPTRCNGNRGGEIVGVKIKHPTKSGYFMTKTITIVDVNEADLEKKAREAAEKKRGHFGL